MFAENVCKEVWGFSGELWGYLIRLVGVKRIARNPIVKVFGVFA